jgi:hypothetical protein
MFLSLLNSMVILQAKCLGFHFVNMFYLLFTIQLSWFFFAWFFQNCKCTLTWFDFWFWKRQFHGFSSQKSVWISLWNLILSYLFNLLPKKKIAHAYTNFLITLNSTNWHK